MKENRRDASHRGYPRNSRRREFLRATVAAIPMAYTSVQAHAASLASTPAAFDATQDSVLIWVRTGSESRVRVDYGASEGQLAPGPVASLTRDTDYCAAVRLAQLEPGKAWFYRIVDPETGKPISEVHRFRTAPAAQSSFSFAFSADMEESYGPFKLFDVIDTKQPHFFLHLGDTIYADHPKNQFSPSLSHYRRKHAANRRDASLQKFLGRYVTYATWDDHEIADGAHAGHPDMNVAFQAYKEYWPCQGVESSALYRHFAWAGVDFFMLDTRRFRSPQVGDDGPDKTMLGASQKSWLLERLKASSAPFKFIMTSVPFHGGGDDTWGRYSTERNELSNLIRSEKIRGVIFLTGDYHLARDWTNKKSGQREFMAGPIASFNAYTRTPSMRDRYEKAGAFHYGDGYNFGLWDVDPSAAKARLQFVGADGKTLFETEVTA